MSKCNTCGEQLTDENWLDSWKVVNRKQCKNCSTKNNISSNPNRMYVNGKYVPQNHPLHQAGRYTSFAEQLRVLSSLPNSLSRISKSKVGEVYIIHNPAWKSWYKIGMAVESKNRLNGYQTSSPFRDYTLLYTIPVKNRYKGESMAHKIAEKICLERNNEWFYTESINEVRDEMEKKLCGIKING
tara:strand:+ start:3035 stop:3589 length:555 start_codon:yes stop_codon:yes gene_type:complete